MIYLVTRASPSVCWYFAHFCPFPPKYPTKIWPQILAHAGESNLQLFVGYTSAFVLDFLRACRWKSCSSIILWPGIEHGMCKLCRGATSGNRTRDFLSCMADRLTTRLVTSLVSQISTKRVRFVAALVCDGEPPSPCSVEGCQHDHSRLDGACPNSRQS